LPAPVCSSDQLLLALVALLVGLAQRRDLALHLAGFLLHLYAALVAVLHHPLEVNHQILARAVRIQPIDRLFMLALPKTHGYSAQVRH
jgi:disulfide bond formation protein DsbB